MKSITIHGVDDQLAARLKQVAESGGVSVNRAVKRLLEEALGMKPKPLGRNRPQFETFLGLWSERDREEFSSAVTDLARVDAEDWR